MKPDWKDAPEWAQWLCQDPDGRWIWFKYKPRIRSDGFEWIQGRKIGMWEFAEADDFVWKTSLEPRP